MDIKHSNTRQAQRLEKLFRNFLAAPSEDTFEAVTEEMECWMSLNNAWDWQQDALAWRSIGQVDEDLIW